MKPVLFVSATALIAASSGDRRGATLSIRPARVAFLQDLSSGAVLYAKDARTSACPPASMAKMMTVYVAFDLIKSGKLNLEQADRSDARRPGGSGIRRDRPCSSRWASGRPCRDLLKGIVTLSGNDACVVLAEGISGTEQAFVRPDEPAGQGSSA
jgi:D-alanyl-D-alanine carboxypeptidase (penicillin-binding protein 5/6)